MRETLRTLRWSGWLGWQVESNWTEPWLFAIYVLVKPVAGSLLLVCMYLAARAATGGAVPTEFLPYIYVGNACFFLVGAIAFGMSYTVISDREHYRMLKYVFISPAIFRAFFLGRGAARGGQAVLGALINLGFGIAFFPAVRDAIFREPIAWGWLAVHLSLGVLMLGSIGMILTAVLMNMARHGMFLSEGIAGVMFFLCGVVFPLGALPGWLRAIGMCLPPTYWLEGIRRSLTGASGLASPLSVWSQAELAAALAASTLTLLVASDLVYRWAVRRARRTGRLEHTTGV